MECYKVMVIVFHSFIMDVILQLAIEGWSVFSHFKTVLCG